MGVNRETRKQERREVIKQLAIEAEIRPDILEMFQSFERFTARPVVQAYKGQTVSYTRVLIAEQGGGRCPFGMGRCGFAGSCPCTENQIFSEVDCLRMAGTDNN